ncbi:hypothetical protein [Francisella hispaniensis]|uniref:Domain amino terminal to FKBP-type peptidyl-prolyl isomerase n=1 Tax=Francisella hispaniensis TaxID=622488 RepID=F4BIC3_9GAMM|nr:hypothetical protein [Francisella hispaniensis]AEB27917.1 hypothetical protein FN3523_0060 [Francisella hispaniensis]
MLIRFFKIIAMTLSVLFSSLGICSQTSTQTSSYYNKGATVAAKFKQQTISGTKQKYSLAEIYKALNDKISNNSENLAIKDSDKNKISFCMGYMTGANSLKKGELFNPKPENIHYNPQTVLQGVYDHYNQLKPKYELIAKDRLNQLLSTDPKSLPQQITNSQFSYSLGYNFFEIPNNSSTSKIIVKQEFIKGMKAGLEGEKYKLSVEQVAEISYIIGTLLYNSEYNFLKKTNAKKQFLAGFHSKLETNKFKAN